jgi:hypothetical protein
MHLPQRLPIVTVTQKGIIYGLLDVSHVQHITKTKTSILTGVNSGINSVAEPHYFDLALDTAPDTGKGNYAAAAAVPIFPNIEQTDVYSTESGSSIFYLTKDEIFFHPFCPTYSIRDINTSIGKFDELVLF